jgi:hypothetical protein
MSRILVAVFASLLVLLPASIASARSEGASVAAERQAHQLVRTAHHLTYRLERRAVFGGAAERRALSAARSLEREARRLRRELSKDFRPADFVADRRLTRETRLAFDLTATRLANVRTGHYLRGELAEARTLIRTLERVLGRPPRPHKPPFGSSHGFQPASSSGHGWHPVRAHAAR